jgi:cobalt/nickel transport system permease protein
MSHSLDIAEAPRSLLADLDPRWKLAGLLPAMLATAFLQSLTALALVMLLALLLLLFAQLPAGFLLPRLSAMALFIAPFLILLPAVNGSGGQLPAVRVGGKAAVIFLFGLVLIGTTPFSRLIHGASAMGLPPLPARIALLCYRYVFVLRDEFLRLRIGMRVRGYRNRVGRHTYRAIGSVAGTLLVRGADRAERVSQAMRCRGFDGRGRSLEQFRTRPKDIAFLLGIYVITGLAVGLDLWTRS